MEKSEKHYSCERFSWCKPTKVNQSHK